MASPKELKALIVLAGKIDSSLQSAINKATKLQNKYSGEVKKTNASLVKAGTIARGVFLGNMVTRGIEKAASALLQAGENGLKLASDLGEVQNVVDVTFGKDAGKINVWSQKALKAFGESELQAKKYSSTLGAMLKSSGITGDSLVKMSTKLTGVAGDFSSFYNIAQDDAFQKIQSGIAGETEPLRQLGINMTEANLNAYALSKGIKTSYEKMNQSSKMALRYSYIMHASKDAQGDFARTQESFANQQRLLKINFEQLAGKIMKDMLPSLAKLMQKANELMKNVDPEKIAAGVKSVTDKVIDLASQYGPDLMQVLWKVKDLLFKAFDAARPILEWLVKHGIPDAIDILEGLIDKATDVYNFIHDNWSKIEPIVWGIVGAIGAFEAGMWALTAAETSGTIIKGLIWLWDLATLSAGALATGEGILTVAQTALNLAMEANPIGVVAIAIGILIGVIVLCVTHWEQITNAVKGFFSWMGKLIKGAPDWALALTGPLAPVLLLIKHFDELKNAASWAWDNVKKFFTGGESTVNTSTTVGHNASGTGYWRGGQTWVGENGPELIDLPRGSKVYSNSVSRNMSGGGGGNTFIFNIDAPGGNAQDIERIIRRILDEYFPDGGPAYGW